MHANRVLQAHLRGSRDRGTTRYENLLSRQRQWTPTTPALERWFRTRPGKYVRHLPRLSASLVRLYAYVAQNTGTPAARVVESGGACDLHTPSHALQVSAPAVQATRKATKTRPQRARGLVSSSAAGLNPARARPAVLPIRSIRKPRAVSTRSRLFAHKACDDFALSLDGGYFPENRLRGGTASRRDIGDILLAYLMASCPRVARAQFP